MSNGEKIQRWVAMTLARAMMDRLAGVCERVEIAGSLRRCKELVGDIEIVCIPRRQADLLGGESYLWGDVRQALACYKMIKGGDYYQQYELESCKADVFATTREQWGVIFAIRTGSAAFSKRLVTRRTYGGMMPDGFHIERGRLWKEGVSIETLEEEDLFRAIGAKWVKPEER